MTLAADWVTISALATAAGTLVLALATFASVRSANRAARVAERSLLEGLRPLLLASKLDDPPQKIGFVDDKWFLAEGGRGIAEARDAVERRIVLIIDLLYGDYEGGQRTITRFALRPFAEDGWTVTTARHWNIDRDDPR